MLDDKLFDNLKKILEFTTFDLEINDPYVVNFISNVDDSIYFQYFYEEKSFNKFNLINFLEKEKCDWNLNDILKIRKKELKNIDLSEKKEIERIIKEFNSLYEILIGFLDTKRKIRIFLDI